MPDFIEASIFPCRQGKLREKTVSALWPGQKFPYSQRLANHARRYSRAWQGNGRETAGKRQGNDPFAFLRTENRKIGWRVPIATWKAGPRACPWREQGAAVPQLAQRKFSGAGMSFTRRDRLPALQSRKHALLRLQDACHLRLIGGEASDVALFGAA